MKKIKLSANVGYANGLTFTLDELGLDENYTQEELEDILKSIVMENLDWGWEEL